MKFSSYQSLNKKLIGLAIFPLLTVGCVENPDTNQSQTTEINHSIDETTVEQTISGSVGDGPVIGSTIVIKDSKGKEITRTLSDDQAHYNANIPKGMKVPVTITATGGTDLVSGVAPSFDMMSATVERSISTVNINPFTTLITKTALAMPDGMNNTNLATATQYVVQELNFGFDINDLTGMPNPITSRVTDVNIANVVKSSETLAEMIRRTTSALSQTGNAVTDDQVIAALASDLADGSIDGLGDNADIRVAETATVVSAQVLLEAMRNQLHVNGADATSQMDAAIAMTISMSTKRTADVAFTLEMLAQARKAVAAAQAIAPSVELSDVNTALNAVTPGLLPADIENDFSAFDSSVFNVAITNVAQDLANDSTNNSGSDTASTTAAPDTGSTTTAPDTGSTTTAPDTGSTTTAPDTGSTTTAPDTGSTTTAPDTGSTTTAPDTGSTTTAPDTGSTTTAPDTGSTSTINDSAIRINAGGEDYIDNNGNLWSADEGYNTGTSYIVSNSIGGTTDQTLYLSERWDESAVPELEYSLDLPNSGEYLVNLHFADRMDPGRRIFDVQIEGQLVLDNFDITAEAGLDTALIKSFPVTVEDGQINIAFLHQLQNPKINAIEILPLTAIDEVTTNDYSPVSINVLSHYSGGGSVDNITIIQNPINGSASVQTDNSIVYTPNGGFAGTDSFIYIATDSNGDNFFGVANIKVDCTTCVVEDKALTLTWDSVPGEVDGYFVYFGNSPDTISTRLTDIPSTSVTYNALSDLGVSPGDTVCFKVTAYNNAGESTPTEAVCGSI